MSEACPYHRNGIVQVTTTVGNFVETLQQQLSVVNTKIEAIHQKIEVISTQIEELIASVQSNDSAQADCEGDRANVKPKAQVHRDVLIDEEPSPLATSKGQTISQELQMQRLMAQLTAAYNRIAALEEQLMAQRFQ
jgi:chromosome segregation ATPase